MEERDDKTPWATRCCASDDPGFWFRRYCDSVCSLVRWRPARPDIAQELTSDLEDHAQALVDQGMLWEDACQKAVAAMGNPYELGKAMDALHSPFWHRVAAAMACLGMGIVLLLGLFWPRAQSGELLVSWEQMFYDSGEGLTGDGWRTVTGVLARGTVSGGGRLGDYSRSPGEAAVVALEDEDGTRTVELRVGYAVFHWQPWLDQINLSASELTAADNLGRQYPGDGEEIQVFPNTDSYTLWREQAYLVVEDPDLEAGAFTLDIDAPNGDRVTFHVALEGGDQG